MLPPSLLHEVQDELLDWNGMRRSILEIGHRTAEFQALSHQAMLDVRELLVIPDNYHLLFLGVPARAQFAMIPMNLLFVGQRGGYLLSGHWSKMAYEEACKVASASCVASAFTNSDCVRTPDVDELQLSADLAYLYYTPNETLRGVRYHTLPTVPDNLPLVADMSSCILSEQISVKDFGMIFASTAKNLGAAGMTLVIIRDDLLAQITAANLPSALDYRVWAQHNSLYATPPMFTYYMVAKMLQWVKAEGGVAVLQQRNMEKAQLLYDYIDSSTFYTALVAEPYRSLMNVCFSIVDRAQEPQFLAQAEQHGLYALRGHSVVGGLRASLYNSMPISGVQALIAFMEKFAAHA